MHPHQCVDDAQELFRQGVDKFRQGDYKAAIQDFDQALQLNPCDATVYGHRCVARHRVGNKQGAVADCRQAATLYLAQGKAKEYEYSLNVLRKLQEEKLISPDANLTGI